MDALAVTWWGHSTVTVEVGGVRILTDPVLVDRFAHLVRRAPSPGPRAAEADLVLVSHLHLDHFHRRSLRRLARGTAIVVPQESGMLLHGMGLEVHEAAPGEALSLNGVDVEVLAADHPASRHRWSKRESAPLGFRVAAGGRAFWFPGDTGPATDVSAVEPVDLALVPVGGWGPTLGPDHIDPIQAAGLVEQVGARWALPIHWGTFWPTGMGRVAPQVREHLFESPGRRFAEALEGSAVEPVVVEQGTRLTLGA